MLEIKPIQSKQEQEVLCAQCRIPYVESAFAYVAKVDEKLTGICQFSILGEKGLIHHLAPYPGTEDREALFIMGRAAMNFIDHCGVHQISILPDATDEAMIKWLGFTQNDAKYEMNTEGFFSSPCSHNK